MATATEISQRALKRLGIVNSGETAAASDVADATEALNAMIAAWEAGWYSGDTLPLDPRFEQGIIAQLAVRISEDYGVQPGPVLLRDAEAGMMQMQAAFFTVPASSFDKGLTQSGTNYTYGTLAGTGPANHAPWQASTAYTLRLYAVNNANLYEVKTAGTSAASVGPTGTGSDIADGTVVWVWRKAVAE